MNGGDFARHGNLFVPKHIIRGGRTIEALIEQPTMRVKGFFTVELIHARTGHVRRRLEFPNLITNAALDAWASVGGSTLFQYAGCGTGSNVPAATDTTLQAEIAPAGTNRTNANGSIADVFGYVAGPPEYVFRRITRLFVEAQANGNLTEFGMFSASSAGTMWSRQLFKDGVGNPTVVTKTNTDQLRVTYELRYYPPAADVVLNPLAISGVNYSVTTRPIGMSTAYLAASSPGLFSDKMGASTATATDNLALLARTQGFFQFGSSALPDTRTQAAYVAGNRYVDSTYVWNPATANFANKIGSVFNHCDAANTTSYWKFQNLFNPVLPKDSTKKLTLVFRESWGTYP